MHFFADARVERLGVGVGVGVGAARGFFAVVVAAGEGYLNPPRAPARFPPNPANPAPPAPPHFAFIRPGVCCESGIAKSRGGGTVANGDGSFPPCKTSPYKSPTGLKHPSCVRGNHPDGVCAWRARGESDDAGAATAAAAAAGAGVFHSPPAAAPPQTCESYPTDASLSTVSGTSSVDVFASAPPGAESSSARVLMLSSPTPPPFASCASSSSNPIGDSPSDGSAARVGGGGAARGVRSSSSSSVQHGGNSVSGTTHCDRAPSCGCASVSRSGARVVAFAPLRTRARSTSSSSSSSCVAPSSSSSSSSSPSAFGSVRMNARALASLAPSPTTRESDARAEKNPRVGASSASVVVVSSTDLDDTTRHPPSTSASSHACVSFPTYDVVIARRDVPRQPEVFISSSPASSSREARARTSVADGLI